MLAGSVLGHRTACARLPLSVLLRGPSVPRDFRVPVLHTQRDGISCHRCPFPPCSLHGYEEDIKVAHVSPASLNLLCGKPRSACALLVPSDAEYVGVGFITFERPTL